jgi:hypothetical protein
MKYRLQFGALVGVERPRKFVPIFESNLTKENLITKMNLLLDNKFELKLLRVGISTNVRTVTHKLGDYLGYRIYEYNGEKQNQSI